MKCLSSLKVFLMAALTVPGMALAQDQWNSPSSFGSYQSTLPKEWNNGSYGSDQGNWNQNNRDQEAWRSSNSFQPGNNTTAQPARYRQDAPGYTPETGAPSQQELYGSQGASAGFYGSQNSPHFEQGHGGSSHAWSHDGNNGPCESESQANWVAGVRGLVFSRDYEDDIGLSTNFNGDSLFSTSADLDYFWGVEAFLGRRTSRGTGWEARYWGLYPSRGEWVLGVLPQTTLNGLSEINYVPSGTTVLDIYNSADAHAVYRNNEFHNLEFDLLRNGGTFRGWTGRDINVEFLGGFRWFQFNEDFLYSAFNSAAGLPTQFNYCSQVRNALLGTQLGVRTTRNLNCRLSMENSFRFGMFHNRIWHETCLGAVAGVLARIGSGPNFDEEFMYTSRKNDVAFLGELEVGLNYNLSSCARFNVGYRVIGVGGVALAPDQIPVNFTDVPDLQRIDSNGSLILHGAYGGLEFCF